MMATPELTAAEIEAAFQTESPRRKDRCIVGRVIDQYPVLGPKIMDVEHYSGATVHRVLKALKIDPTPASKAVTEHRRGVCCCKEETP